MKLRKYKSKKGLRTTFLASLIALALPTFAWFETGHMVVAEIALRHLEPNTRKQALELLQEAYLDARTNDFRTASVWADDHKSSADAHWHYINWFFKVDGSDGSGKPREENVVWAIEKFRALLSDTASTKGQRAQAMVWLLHFVGDIHQPMHSVARESAAHPTGDRGGNEFSITSPDSITPPVRNLHFLWDSGGGYFPKVVRPLNDVGQRTIARLADECEKSFSWDKAQTELHTSDSNRWAKESFALAKSEAYDLKEGEVPSEAYLKNCRAISMRRVTLAGYRLAAVLNKAL